MKKIIYLIIYIIVLMPIFSLAQAKIIATNSSQIKQNGGYLVLQNAGFNNSSTFHSSSGTVVMSGSSSTVQSQIDGTSTTTFYNLKINKSTNNVSLGQDITINNQLAFIGGQLELGNHDLTMGNTSSFLGVNKDRYIKTNGTGFLIRQVGATWTPFPVGKVTFNPARLKNDGTLDNFKIRVEDHFLQNGTAGSNLTTNVIPKTWLIEEETIGGSDVSMRLIWRPAHIGSGFDATASQITHFTGGTWQDQSAGAATADNSYSSDHKYREATNITSFSPFGVKSGASLPVELLYFYAEKEGENVRLEWQTATEINNSHFDVEWSTDGISFQKIGEVAGAGTTNEVQFYDFLDDLNRVGFQNRYGLHYYRLKQVDFDEKNEYTNIISIEFKQSNNTAINIYPNPASHYLKIESAELIDEIIQIFDVNGQLVKTFYQNTSSQYVDVTDLASGTYFVKVGQEVKKVVVNK